LLRSEIARDFPRTCLLRRAASTNPVVFPRSSRRRRGGPQALDQAAAQRRRLNQPPRTFVPPRTGFIVGRGANWGSSRPRAAPAQEL